MNFATPTSAMPAVPCAFHDCDFVTIDASDNLAITLLQMHCTDVHTPPTTPTNTLSSVKAEKVRRPTIFSAGSSKEWSYFLARWSDYKEATNIILQLQECCDDDLRKDLTRAAGGSLTIRTEDQVLASIKKLAVREENTMVARVTLHEMRQDHSVPIWSFGARI